MPATRYAVLPAILLTVLGGSLPARSVGSLDDRSLDDQQSKALRPGGQYLTFSPANTVGGVLLETLDPSLAAGRDLFYRDWLIVADAEEQPRLGPHYDASTCSGCHIETARTTAQRAAGYTAAIARPVDPAHVLNFGSQITTKRIGAGAPEARIDIESVEIPFRYADGETRSLRKLAAYAIGPGGEQVRVALRTAPLLFGWGLMEKADPEILAYFDDPDDRNADGISGRLADTDGAGVRNVHSTLERVPLFGWKSTHRSLRAQIAAALANDMGLTSPGNCGDRANPPTCSAEVSDAELDALTDYVRHLGVPNRRRVEDPKGQHLFGLSGCSDCHVSVLRTIPDEQAELAGQIIWPYSDLMLHDMGPGLAEPGNAADTREWRTAPLWGVGLAERQLPKRGFLHDGRARSIEEAILWHGGEAKESARKFKALSRSDRETLLAFVRSL